MVTTIERTISAFLFLHADYFRSKGWQVDCVSNPMDQPFPECADHFDNVYHISWTRTPFDYINYTGKPVNEILTIVTDGKYDIVHVLTPVASILTRFALRKLQRAGITKIVYSAHGFHFYMGAPLHNWLLYYPFEKWLAKYTDALVTTNKEDYDLAVRKKFRAGKIYEILGPGVDFTKYRLTTAHDKIRIRKEYGFEENDFILFFAGELNKNKNQQFLINAMVKLVSEHRSIKLLLAGDGPCRAQLESITTDLKLEENVFLLGFHKDIPTLVAMSDIGVSSSLREGLGLNVIEYEACGLPVVVTANRGHMEIIQNDVNGFLVDQNDIEQFTERVLRLYEDKKLYNAISSRCRTSVIDRFGLQTILEQTEKIYLNLLN